MKKYLLLCIIGFSQLFADLIHPQDGDTISYIHVKFQWENEDNASEYIFELSTENDFSSTFQTSVTDLQYVDMDNIIWQETYFWRVSANGGTSWINTNSFSTGSTLSNVSVAMYNNNNYADGYTIFGDMYNKYSAIIDRDGNEIWNSGDQKILYQNFDENGSFFGATENEMSEYPSPGIKFSLTDGILWEEPNEEYVHHEFLELPWGDYVGIAHEYRDGPIYAPDNYIYDAYQNLDCVADGVTIEWPWQGDRLVIWDKDTKAVKWTWSTFDYFSMDDYDDVQWYAYPVIGGHFDWTHVNAIYYDDSDNTFLISTRNLSRITKIQIQEDNGVISGGEIIWNMGHEYPSGDVTFGHELGFSQQHSISITDADNILILDNGNYAEQYWGAEEPTTRALEIAVSGSAGNYLASIDFEYSLTPNLFGSESGNVQQLENGNYLITTVGGDGTTLEVTPDGDLVWQANYDSFVMWRASRIESLYPVPIECTASGDVNGDGGWNVLDIVQLTNCILQDNCDEHENGCAGDLNGDGGWNVLDVVILSNCILQNNCGG